MSRFALAKTFTPLLNSSAFPSVFGGVDGRSLPLDEQGLLRPVEMVAFPETKFHLIRTLSKFVVEVKTDEYPYSPLYADRRFLIEMNHPPQERTRSMPSAKKILAHLKNLIGSAYIWGGNHSKGIPELLHHYPPKTTDPKLLNLWALKGVDCSGLLYEATEGATPRNTSELVRFGRGISIQNCATKEICAKLRPLDAIVWKGHLVLFLGEDMTIESLGNKGVVVNQAAARLEEIRELLNRHPADHISPSSFVIRRWHDNFI